MKMFNSYHTLLLLAIAFVLAFAVPLKAQDGPQAYLNAHNRARSAVGVGPLEWSETLAAYARDYAGQRRDCLLIISGAYDENLAVTVTDSAEATVSIWVNMKSDYNYATNTCRAGTICLPYVIVVNRRAAWLGCAKARCDNGLTFTICYYNPNYVLGERPY